MARSTKAPTALPARIARARSEGRTKQALELMRQLCKQDPSEEHTQQLRQVQFERGCQLEREGHTRDAATVFATLVEHGCPPELRASVAERLMACGDADRAMQVLSGAGDPVLRQRMMGHVADLAMRLGAAGKGRLPPELHADFDAIVSAFDHSESGRDEEARAALQAIGLQSPFLEWKLLLRGLLAYYVREDARALENWQRLDSHRVPSRLAAPLRLGIDAHFRRAQPAATQNTLQRQSAQLAGQSTTASLEALRKALADTHSLAAAFRIADPIVAELRRNQPRVVPRLANCFFWAIVSHGQPEDVERYCRTFGLRISDAESQRLQALALDHRQVHDEAHLAWQDYARSIADAPQEWPGEAGKRAQALIWSHLGMNAVMHEEDHQPEFAFGFFGRQPRRKESLKPGPAECFERSITLAPDRLDGYLDLFHLYQNNQETAKAQKVGQRLLDRFPDHAATSEALGDLALETKDAAKARAYFERALKANPLERRLRKKLAQARENQALEFTLAGRFDAARAEYEGTMPLREDSPTSLLCQWAILETKAGQPDRAAELIARALQTSGQRLAVRYGLVSESIRAKLPTAARKRIAADLTQALAESPTPAEVLGLLAAAALQRARKLDNYRGQKTHERNFIGFLEKIPLIEFTEEQLMKLCGYLGMMDARAPWKRCLEWAEQAFPDNPGFAMSEADYYLKHRNPESQRWHIRSALDAARQRVQKMPREGQEQYLPALRMLEERANEVAPASPHPFEMLNHMFAGMDEWEDDDDDDGYF